MSTSAPPLAQPDPTVPLAPAGRGLVTGFGHTTIAPLVCEKIAARAASEVDGVRVVGTGLSRRVPWTTSPAAGAAADVDGQSVAVNLSLRLRYPAPAGETAARVRERVTLRLAELAGLTVREVTITVAELVADDRPRRSRVE